MIRGFCRFRVFGGYVGLGYTGLDRFRVCGEYICDNFV